MAKVPEDLFRRGPKGFVQPVVLMDGSMPAWDFYDGLPPPAKARYEALLNRVAEMGFINNEEKLKRLRDDAKPDVWEFKVHIPKPGFRMYAIQDNGRWLLCCGDTKDPKNKNVTINVQRARRIFNDRRDS